MYTEAEVFISCSIRRRAEGNPSPPFPTLPYMLETWVDQNLPCSIPLSSRLPLDLFGLPRSPSFFLSLQLPPLSLADGFRSPLHRIISSQLPFVHTSHSLHCCMLLNSLHGRFARQLLSTRTSIGPYSAFSDRFLVLSNYLVVPGPAKPRT